MHHSDELMDNPTTSSETCADMLLKHHTIFVNLIFSKFLNLSLFLSLLWQVLCKPQDICCGIWTVRVYTWTHRLSGQHTGGALLIFYSFRSVIFFLSDNVNNRFLMMCLFGFVNLVVRSSTQTAIQSLDRTTRVSVVMVHRAPSGSCSKSRWRFCPM